MATRTLSLFFAISFFLYLLYQEGNSLSRQVDTNFRSTLVSCRLSASTSIYLVNCPLIDANVDCSSSRAATGSQAGHITIVSTVHQLDYTLLLLEGIFFERTPLTGQSLYRLSGNLLDKLPQRQVVRSLPIDLIAILANMKLVVILLGKGFETVLDLVFGDFS